MTTQTQHGLTRRLRAHSLVRCRVSCALCWSWFSRCHWCRTCHRSVSPRIRNSKFLLDVEVRLCLVIVNSDCSHNSCMLHIPKTGPLRCCPYKIWTILRARSCLVVWTFAQSRPLTHLYFSGPWSCFFFFESCRSSPLLTGYIYSTNSKHR